MFTYPYLHLDCIPTNRIVMKLLPHEIAYRHHVLPVAMDGASITVAMASPGDPDAIDAVRSVIDVPICLIQADPKEIENKIIDLWSKKPKAKINLVDWSESTSADKVHQLYVESFAKLLTANLIRGDSTRWSYRSYADLTDFSRKPIPELHIFQKNTLKPLYQMRRYSSLLNGKVKLPDSLLLPLKPYWKLKKILLILTDYVYLSESAVNWTLLLADLSPADVTVLPIISPAFVPGGEVNNFHSEDLLAQEGSLGNNLRVISTELSNYQINCSFNIQTGTPINQVEKELQHTKPDFVIFSRSPHSSEGEDLASELMSFFLNRYHCPVLISQD